MASHLSLTYQPPSEIVYDYISHRGPFCAIKGPLGSGKTQATIIKLLQMMQEQTPNKEGVRPTRLFIIRNTYPDLITTTIRDWVAITGRLAPVKGTHPPQQLIRFPLKDGTAVECDVIFLALDKDEHIRKIRGTQGTFAWLNEMKELPFGVIEMIDARLGRFPSRPLAGVECDHAGMIVGDTNAPDDDHWYAVHEKDPPKGWTFFKQPGAVMEIDGEWVVRPDADNLINLPKGYYDKLLSGKRRDWIRVNLANENGIAIDGKAVFPEFQHDVHVRERDPLPELPIIYGQDFGLTPAMVLAQDLDGVLFVFDEVVTENFSAEELAEAATQRKATQWPQLKWGHGWGDPSNPRSQADKNTPIAMMQSHGFRIYKAPTNDFTLRRDAVGTRFNRMVRGKPAIIIHPRCKYLIKGCSGHYMYRRVKVSGDERFHDVPEKNIYSHICEALQYLCIGVGDGDLLMYGDHSSPHYEDWSQPVNNRRGNKSYATGYKRRISRSDW